GGPGKPGAEAGAPAAAAPARKARRDGPLAGLSVRTGSGSWRGCIGSPRYVNQAPRGPSAPGSPVGKPSMRLVGSDVLTIDISGDTGKVREGRFAKVSVTCSSCVTPRRP